MTNILNITMSTVTTEIPQPSEYAHEAYDRVGFKVDLNATFINTADGNYAIFYDGRVFTNKVRKYLKPKISGHGYLYIVMFVNGRHKNVNLHSLIAKTFIPNDSNYVVVNHIDGNKLNPHKDNLEWCTHQQNATHAKENGFYNKNIGRSRKVMQYDLDGNWIAEFPSAAEVSRSMGIVAKEVWECCNGGKYKTNPKTKAKEWVKRLSAGGFVFKWKDDVDSIHNKYNSLLKEATSYATKLQSAEEENKRLIKTLLELEEGKRRELEQKIKVIDFDNKKLKGQYEGLQQAMEELKRENEKLKVIAIGWRPLLEDILREDDNNIAYISVDLINKIKKFLYGE